MKTLEDAAREFAEGLKEYEAAKAETSAGEVLVPEVLDNEPPEGIFDVRLELKKLQRLLIKDLIARIESGTASHQELAIAHRILVDTGVDLLPVEDRPSENKAIEDATKKRIELPEFPEDESEA